jgi:hypothetical protein
VPGSRKDAEAALARLKVAAQQRRAPSGRTTPRSVRAALDLYLEAADAGTIELAPRTILTSRSAANTMCSMVLLDGRPFGAIQLHRLTWKEIEEMFGAMRTNGSTSDWVRRCATVLSRSLEFSCKRGLIDSNPSKDAERPRSTRSKPTSPKSDEVRRVLALAGERDPELADAVLVWRAQECARANCWLCNGPTLTTSAARCTLPLRALVCPSLSSIERCRSSVCPQASNASDICAAVARFDALVSARSHGVMTTHDVNTSFGKLMTYRPGSNAPALPRPCVWLSTPTSRSTRTARATVSFARPSSMARSRIERRVM